VVPPPVTATGHAPTPRGVDVCVVGSANLDLVAGAPRIPTPGETVLGSSYAEHPGGKGLNQAVAAARSGATVVFAGAVGADAAGDRLRAVLTDEGIDGSALATAGKPTGRALIIVDERGENSIVVVPGANATVAPPRPLPAAAVVLCQLEIPLSTVTDVLVAARAAGARTVLNPAPASALPDAALAACDVIVPNEHEVELLGGVETLLRAGCGAVVVTRGGAGVDVHTTGAATFHVSPFAVDVIDTTGAGDAFCGSLAARLAAGDPLTVAVRWAAAAGALATTVPGAVPAQPRAEAIRELLARA
jgi:ribokinase